MSDNGQIMKHFGSFWIYFDGPAKRAGSFRQSPAAERRSAGVIG
jgi:hypothetical protein